MKIIPIPAFTDNYIWSLIDEHDQSLICVDPGEAAPVLAFLQQERLNLRAIFLTHHHFDHINGINELIQHYPQVITYGPDDERITPPLTQYLQDGDMLSIHPYRFQIIATPGHTATHINFYEFNHQWLFCGDTLFSAGCGRVFDGTIEDLFASIQKLKALPDETKIYCGHEYTLQNLRFAASVEPDNLAIHQRIQQIRMSDNPCSLPSTIALEKTFNPFFRVELPSVQKFVASKGETSHDSLLVFKMLRKEKDIYP